MSATHSQGPFSVEFSKEVLSLFESYRQIGRLSKEACGVMIGSISDERETKISSATRPGKKDKRRRRSFEICDPSHQKAVDDCFRVSGGRERFLGTWHTHPENTPLPSQPDIKGWDQCRDKNPDFPQMLFVIVGTGSLRGFSWSESGYVEVYRREFKNDY